jgi:hypothetical protein
MDTPPLSELLPALWDKECLDDHTRYERIKAILVAKAIFDREFNEFLPWFYQKPLSQVTEAERGKALSSRGAIELWGWWLELGKRADLVSYDPSKKEPPKQ